MSKQSEINVGDINSTIGAAIGSNAKADVTIINQGDEVYNVNGLKNPYIGLAAFTYKERDRYAGREIQIAQAVKLLTESGNKRVLLFITGASGSGKSSFAQAGLLPALENYYKERNQLTKKAVFRPSQQPLAGLSDALHQLGVSAKGPFSNVNKYILDSRVRPTDTNQISILVIDQFEELFTQSVPHQRDLLLDMLESLPDFAEFRMHIIVTLRIDYSTELYTRRNLYNISKQGIDLRVMSINELQLAIQQPLQQMYPNGEKRFEKALLCNGQ